MTPVRLEVRRAYYDLDAARQQIEVARASDRRSQGKSADQPEPLRLRTFDHYRSAGRRGSGPAQSDDYWEAIYHYHTGYANLELASGTLNPQSPVVTP